MVSGTNIPNEELLIVQVAGMHAELDSLVFKDGELKHFHGLCSLCSLIAQSLVYPMTRSSK